MSTLTKRLLIFALWVLYMILLWIFFKPSFEANCCAGAAAVDDTVTSTVDNAVNNHPLASRWDTLGLFEGPGFAEYRSGILANQGDNNILEIIGHYYEGEVAPAGYESMGLARAAKIREMYFADIPDERIKLSARPYPSSDAVKTGYFPAGSFNWIQPEETVKEDVEELEDRILIRFPYNSTEKVYNQAVDGYLQKLAAQMKETGESVQLTGHTDNVGEDAYNMSLGMERAQAIKDILVGYGVAADQIQIDSKGKRLPLETNSTEAGRQANRRVVVQRINE